jgi:hypothetical protein
MRRRLAILSFAFAFAGCATSTTPSAADAGIDLGSASDTTDNTPQVLVGGANSDGSGFVDWQSGIARPAIITGIQGGQHVFVSVRTRGLFPQQAKITATVATPVDCTPYDPGPSQWKVSLKSDSGWYGYQGITAFVGKPCAIKDKVVRVKIEVEDQNGVTASSYADIEPTWNGACP